MGHKTIKVETRGQTGLITLNRPKALNALNNEMMVEIIEALKAFDDDHKVGAIVITGSEKAFAAGADIKEMQELTYSEAYLDNLMSGWEDMARIRKPMIAAVAGFALGGGCELAMMCDFIIAADTAKFGQPEITLGIIPGIGGTQRLSRAVGSAKAMDLCLTGRKMGAEEAESSGLVARVVPAGELIEEALSAANKIATYSRPAVLMAKEAVHRSNEVNLEEGLRFERRLFQSLFAFEDQKEGMTAFVEKRAAQFKHK